MEKNQLFLILPCIEGNEPCVERVYLRTIEDFSPIITFEALIKDLVQVFSWVKDEVYDLYYDHKYFLELYKMSDIEGTRQRPSPLQLLGGLSNLNRIPSSMPSISINHVEFSSGVLCSYVNSKNDKKVVVDYNAFIDSEHLQVADTENQRVSFNIIRCEREEVFKWFVNNRTPERVLDNNYAKHGKALKFVNGRLVSAITYNKIDYENMLPWAIGGKDHRRKYVMDLTKNRLIIFMNENLDTPTFHCFDVDISDPEENAKMNKDCGREIVNQIKSVCALR